MAIQFPPINPGDPAPNNGDLYLDTHTGNVWEYSAEENSWTVSGLVDYGAFVYKGETQITSKAPINIEVGYIYSVSDGGIADNTFIGLAGQDIPQWTLIVVGPNNVWAIMLPIDTNVTPFIQTADHRIVPTENGRDLDMLGGSYVISSLEDLP